MSVNDTAGFDKEVDLLIIGAGAGGMTAALCATFNGLEVLLCEKTDQVGGNTSTSGGTTWVPGTKLSDAAGVPDRIDAADTFLRHIVGNRGGDLQRRAFLAAGPEAIAEIVEKSQVRFAAAVQHPDYLDGPGFAMGGRALSPLPFDGKRLGRDFDRVRPPRDVFMGLGGMMVGRAELAPLLRPFASVQNLRTTLGVVLPYFLDRLRLRRGSRWLMGNALVGQLFLSLRQRKVPIAFDTTLVRLLTEGDNVIGAVVKTQSGEQSIRTRKGVVLATGGIGHNAALRDKLIPKEVLQTQMPACISGDGITVALQSAGARLNHGGDSAGLWMPCSLLKRADGKTDIWPHILLDRAKPGLIAVGRNGQRFVNESDSYHDFCAGMIKAGLSEAWLVVDHAFILKYGLGLVLPGGRGLGRLLRAGYLTQAPSLTALSAKIGIDAKGLEQSVAANNRYAVTGNDLEFGRGSSEMNRYNGDSETGPNPCIGPIKTGPFYALRVVTMDLASAAGLDCDENGRVMNDSGRAIAGLYACGNDATTLFRGTYPGPGTTIGPAMVGAWRIARHAAGLPLPTWDER